MSIKHMCKTCGAVAGPPNTPKCDHDNIVTGTYDPVYAAAISRAFQEDQEAFQAQYQAYLEKQEADKQAKVQEARRKSKIKEKPINGTPSEVQQGRNEGDIAVTDDPVGSGVIEVEADVGPDVVENQEQPGPV